MKCGMKVAGQEQFSGDFEKNKLNLFIQRGDKFIFYFGSFSAFVAGAAMPSMALLFGDMTDSFNPQTADEDPLAEIRRIAILFAVIGFAAWLMSYIFFAAFLNVAAKTSAQFKTHYLASILKQEFEFFDTSNPQELPSKMSSDCLAIQSALSEKLG